MAKARTRRSNLSNEKQRLKQLLWLMIRKHQPKCFFCGETFVYEDILPPRGIDTLTDHHIDGDHDNSDPQNRTLAHRVCHKSHHSKDNINREKEEVTAEGMNGLMGEFNTILKGRHD